MHAKKDLIKSLYNDFGQEGSLFEVKPRSKKHQQQLRWGMSHRKLYRLLKLILPFMREKRKINKIGIRPNILRYKEI